MAVLEEFRRSPFVIIGHKKTRRGCNVQRGSARLTLNAIMNLSFFYVIGMPWIVREKFHQWHHNGLSAQNITTMKSRVSNHGCESRPLGFMFSVFLMLTGFATENLSHEVFIQGTNSTYAISPGLSTLLTGSIFISRHHLLIRRSKASYPTLILATKRLTSSLCILSSNRLKTKRLKNR